MAKNGLIPKIVPVGDILAGNAVALGQAYAKAQGCKLASVSRLVHSDPLALDNLATGEGSMSLRKYDSVMAKFIEIWPDGLPMPALRLPVFPKAARKGKAERKPADQISA